MVTYWPASPFGQSRAVDRIDFYDLNVVGPAKPATRKINAVHPLREFIRKCYNCTNVFKSIEQEKQSIQLVSKSDLEYRLSQQKVKGLTHLYNQFLNHEVARNLTPSVA